MFTACEPANGLDEDNNGDQTEQPGGGNTDTPDEPGGGNQGNPNAPGNPGDIPADKTRAIKFQDENTKLICILHWDENGDGEFSYEEAAAVTNLGNAFKGSRILAFSELEFFTGLTDIAKHAFGDCASLVNISLPKQITYIGTDAFSGCMNLKKVNHPDLSAWCKIDFSGSNANPLHNGAKFYVNGVEQTNLTIPSDIAEIKFCAFFGCTSLKSVTIGNSVTSIGGSAFEGCGSLESIIIPDSITEIGHAAFKDCTGELIVNCNIPDGDANTFSKEYAFYGSKFTKVTIGDSVTSIGDYAFYDCTSLTSVTIHDSVTSIGYEAFEGCTSLTDTYVNITDLAAHSKSNPMYKIGGSIHLFVDGKEITELVIPDSITSIGDYAFDGCSNLTSITIPDSVTSIGEEAFSWCRSLTSVTIPDSVTEIKSSTFEGCKSLTSITIPDSVTSIGYRAFFACSSLTSVTIPDSVTSIGEGAFSKCSSLISVTIPDSVTSIGDEAFSWCSSLTSVTIPDSVTSIRKKAFINCTSLTSVTIGNGVTSIGVYAFHNCSSLTSVTIGYSVTSIGDEAFYMCPSLKEVYCKPTTPPTLRTDLFDSNTSGRTIYVPRNSVNRYKSNSYWMYYNIVGHDFDYSNTDKDVEIDVIIDSVVGITGNPNYEKDYPSDSTMCIYIKANGNELESIKFFVSTKISAEVTPEEALAQPGTMDLSDQHIPNMVQYGYTLINCTGLTPGTTYNVFLGFTTIYGKTQYYRSQYTPGAAK